MSNSTEKEVLSRINIIFKTLWGLLAYAGFTIPAKEHLNWFFTMISIAIAIYLIVLIFRSYKCTLAGFHVGFDFYFFNFYRKFYRWEECRSLEIDRFALFTYGIWTFSTYANPLFQRWLTTNFDEVAELISCNKAIEPMIRQKFIDYIEKRKLQGLRYKILRFITCIVIAYGLIMIIDHIARSN